MDYRVRAGAAGMVYKYNVPYSCRFDDGASGGKLTRTQGTPTGSKAFTYSFWFKGKTDMAGLNDNKDFTFLDASSTDNDFISMGRLNGKFSFALRGGTGDGGYLVTSEELRDPGAWYHMVIAVNTEETTASDRMRMYKNGTEITSFSTETNCAEDYVLQNFNTSGVSLRVGQEAGSYPGGAYMAETHFIDGQQLTPSSFGETNSDSNQWEAKQYTGTYGDNGFYLKFQDSSNLGDDSSGEGNDFTVANLTANNQVGDGPKTSDAVLGSTSAGGNWCTLNPLDTGDNGSWNGDLEDGNLKLAGTAGVVKSRASFALDTTNGSYWEVRWGASTDANCGISQLTQNNLTTSSQVGAGSALETGYKGSTGVVDTNGSTEATYATSAEGTIVAFAYKAGRLYVGQVASASAAPTWFNSGDPVAGTGYVNSVVKPDADYWAAACGLSHTVNFGQDSSFGGEETAQGNADINGFGDFWGTVPTGFLSLCTANLADPAIPLSSENFSTVLYTGNSSTNVITGVGHQPDFVWIKSRTSDHSNQLYDSNRGVNLAIYSDTNAEQFTDNDSLMSFDTNGFTLGAEDGCNNSSNNYVAWNWKAGGAPTATNSAGAGNVPTAGSVKINGANSSSALAGTIPATKISANTTNGLSTVTYVGANSNTSTVAHGLGVAPDLVAIKRLDAAGYWIVSSPLLQVNTYPNDMYWNDTSAQQNDQIYGGQPTSSVFQIRASTAVNAASGEYVAYCYNSIEGYSKIGSYKGTGNANGTFIYTGFAPAYLWVKCYDTAGFNWYQTDNMRAPYNERNKTLYIDRNVVEETYSWVDFVSNGFKIRTSGSGVNNSSQNYLFYAVAKSPFKTSNAR